MSSPLYISHTVIKHSAHDAVSLQEAKQQCNVDHDDDNVLFAHFIKAAQRHVENLSGWSLTPRTICASFSDWPTVRDPIHLPYGPVNEVCKVEWIDCNADVQAFDPDCWTKHPSLPSVILRSNVVWPVCLSIGHQGVQVTYVAGHPTPNSIQEELKHSVLLLVAHYDKNRELGTASIPKHVVNAVEHLTATDRNFY